MGETAFGLATGRLNSANDRTLWLTTCLLSLAEWGGSRPLARVLNFEKLRLLSLAVLASKAAPYKRRRLDADDVQYVLNHLVDGMDEDEAFEWIHSSDDPEERARRFLVAFSRLGNAQFRHQNPDPVGRAGRLFGLFQVIPTDHYDLLQSGVQTRARGLPAQMAQRLGLKPDALVILHAATIRWYGDLGHRVAVATERLVGAARADFPFSDRHREARALRVVIDAGESLARSLTFSEAILPGSAKERRAFLALMSKGSRDLRAEFRRQWVEGRGLGYQHNPLERWPIVRLGSDEFVVPNLRVHVRACEDAFHFAAQAALGDEFNEVRGHLIEAYLYLLVRNRLPAATVVREREYRDRGQKVRGADLTLIEGRTLLLIEAKARRLRLEARTSLDAEALDRNLQDVYEAIGRAGKKHDALYRGLPEYADVQDAIAVTTGSVPLVVVVVAEAPTFVNQRVRQRASHVVGHPLSGSEMRYCIVSSEDFERAVEVAATHEISLYHLFEEYWDDSASSGPGGTAPELFRGRAVRGLRFARTFIPTSGEGAGA